jgi:hypothetical protein
MPSTLREIKIRPQELPGPITGVPNRLIRPVGQEKDGIPVMGDI